MKTKKYELKELENVRYANHLLKNNYEFVFGDDKCCVEYNGDLYTTKKNIDLLALHNKIMDMVQFLRSEGLGDRFKDNFPYDLYFSSDETLLIDGLLESFYSSVQRAIGNKYGDEDGYPDTLIDCVIDPDNEDEFLEATYL